jgi:MoaA/NifB/PqqE/SkfB family radical SAM enzyme
MNAKDFATHIYPKTFGFKAARAGLRKAPGPITLTFSVTNRCNSRCKTCNIWEIYPNHWQDPTEELTLTEIEKIFTSMGEVYFFNLSGGEPFLRDDLPEIVDLAIEHLKPRIIHSPTNGIMPNRIIGGTRKILENLRARGLDTPVTIKPSIDGVAELHDEIRGVKGNWGQLLKTIKGLQELEQEFPNLHVELGTVVSNFNKDRLDEIEDYVHSLGVQSYRNEIAEQREEFFNIGDPITPTGEEYAELMGNFAEKVRENLPKKRPLARTTESLRLVYYELAARIVQEERQVIPCYAGISNVHLTPHGVLWPCCVLGYAKPLGDLRENGYDFWKVWHSEQAETVRASIKAGECACPLANQAYSNILCHTPSMVKAVSNVVRYGGAKNGE